MPYTPTQRQSLRHHCTLTLPGFKSLSPAEEFKALAAWCEAGEGEGAVVAEGLALGGGVRHGGGRIADGQIVVHGKIKQAKHTQRQHFAGHVKP
jgi:hypothetical protein